jgi:hypothetical protein
MSQKVLVLAGQSAELYDPFTNEFQSVAARASALFDTFSTFTLLGDGRVLLAGGTNARKETAVYDPHTMTFSSSFDLIKEREVHTATWLEQTSILITGGFNTNEAEIFDTETGSQLTGEMRQPRNYHIAVCLRSGNVLIVGGSVSGRMLKSTEVYYKRTRSFIPGADMNLPRLGHTATLLPDGCVVVIGGLLEMGEKAQATNLVEKNCPDGDDVVAKNFVAIGKFREARAYHTATLLDNTRILVAGGTKTGSHTVKDIVKSREFVPID